MSLIDGIYWQNVYEADKPKEKIPETNYQRLVRKTPEELAEWLNQGCCPSDHGGTDIGNKKGYCSDYSCKDCWLDWMMQEAEK